MATNHQSNSSNSSDEELRRLRESNAALQEQVAHLQAEREAYLQRAVHSLAKQMLTEEVVQGWMTEERVEGCMMDFINEVRDQKCPPPSR